MIGGAGGARSLNESMPADACDGWAMRSPAGKSCINRAKANCRRRASRYRDAGVDALVVAFIDEMAPVMFDSDLVVCRAGGTTLAELALAGVPAVLVPYPAVMDFQMANAEVFAAAGAATIIDETDLPGRSTTRWSTHLRPLFADESRRDAWRPQCVAWPGPMRPRNVTDAICDILCRAIASQHGRGDSIAASACRHAVRRFTARIAVSSSSGGSTRCRRSSTSRRGSPPPATSRSRSKSSLAASIPGTTHVSVARMKSPSGWVEPGQRPEFPEICIVLSGMLHVEHEGGAFDVQRRAGRRVRAGRMGPLQHAARGAEYIAICLPAFSPDTVHRDDRTHERHRQLRTCSPTPSDGSSNDRTGAAAHDGPVLARRLRRGRHGRLRHLRHRRRRGRADGQRRLAGVRRVDGRGDADRPVVRLPRVALSRARPGPRTSRTAPSTSPFSRT